MGVCGDGEQARIIAEQLLWGFNKVCVCACETDNERFECRIADQRVE